MNGGRAVDFLEFCIYMLGQRNGQFESLKGRQSILKARPSFAIQSQRCSSVVESTAGKLVSTRALQVFIDEYNKEEAKEMPSTTA
jgi:hypothetical protein